MQWNSNLFHSYVLDVKPISFIIFDWLLFPLPLLLLKGDMCIFPSGSKLLLLMLLTWFGLKDGDKAWIDEVNSWIWLLEENSNWSKDPSTFLFMIALVSKIFSGKS